MAGQQLACGWCVASVTVPARGAGAEIVLGHVSASGPGEQARAAASGRSAIQVVDRTIETVTTVTVVQHHTAQVPIPSRPASVPEFDEVLADLTRRVDSGRVYDRDLPVLIGAARDLVEALSRREEGRPPAPVVTLAFVSHRPGTESAAILGL